MFNAGRVEIYDGPDRNGDYRYALFWMAGYHPGHPDGEYGWRERGQHFRAKLPDREVPRVDMRPGAAVQVLLN